MTTCLTNASTLCKLLLLLDSPIYVFCSYTYTLLTLAWMFIPTGSITKVIFHPALCNTYTLNPSNFRGNINIIGCCHNPTKTTYLRPWQGQTRSPAGASAKSSILSLLRVIQNGNASWTVRATNCFQKL